MTGLAPYLKFDGTARAALELYAETFGATAQLHTFAEFGREDGSPELIAHGEVHTPNLSLFAADAGTGEDSFVARGIMFSLLGTAEPATLHAWFDRLSQDAVMVQPLEQRPWGACDGQVVDRFGVHWLIGYQTEPAEDR